MWQNIKNIYHLFQGIIAVFVFGFPARKIQIIGVTGTDGKTTTASLLYHIITQAGRKAALISSVSAIIGDNVSSTGFHITTPGRFSLQRYIKKAKKEQVEYIVLEISSHGLDQYRDFGIPFVVGIVTNIANEHLDYHKTYDKYVKAKAKLLKKARYAVVNRDDKSFKYLKPLLKQKKIITYGQKKDADVNPHLFPFETKLVGVFNRYNCLGAIATLRVLHFSDDTIRSGIATFKPPSGRQEIVYNKEFIVMIDFAHTPLAFKSILPAVRNMTQGRLIHVFGAAGKRDHYKRSEMGQLSSQYADIMILTAEDPRSESIENINAEIKEGIKDRSFESVSQDTHELQEKKKYLIEITDRKKAIFYALSIAQKGDLLLLTGKGHEQSMNYGRGEEQWSEHEVVKKALQEKHI